MKLVSAILICSLGSAIGFGCGYMLTRDADDSQIDVDQAEHLKALQRENESLTGLLDRATLKLNSTESTLKETRANRDQLALQVEKLGERLRSTKSERQETLAASKDEAGMSVEERAKRLASMKERFAAFAKNPSSSFVNQSAFNELISEFKALGKEGLDFALNLLTEGDANQQFMATQLLGNSSDPAAAKALADTILSSDSEQLATMASMNLMRSDADGVEDELSRTLANGTREGPRVNTMWGLCRHGNAEGIRAAVAYLSDTAANSSYQDALARSLFVLDEPGILPVIEQAIARSEGPSREITIRQAIGWFGRVQSDSHRRRLEELSGDAGLSEAVRQEARDALQLY